MKTSHCGALAASISAMCLTVAVTPSFAQTDPAIPVGNLDAFPTIVQTGTHPTLTWDIEYPSVVTDVVDVDGPNDVTPKVDLYMDVRVVGTGVTRAWTNRYGQVYRTESVVTQCWMKVNSGSWSLMFQGDLYDVNPNDVLYTKLVRAGDSIEFGGRYLRSSGYWHTFYSTQYSDQNIIALVDGDTVPNNIPDWGAPSLESFLEPYMDQQNRVQIGPMDVFYVMELTHTNQDDSGFDLQDLIVLVTFRRVES